MRSFNAKCEKFHKKKPRNFAKTGHKLSMSQQRSYLDE